MRDTVSLVLKAIIKLVRDTVSLISKALTVLEGIMEGLRHQGRPRRQWIHDIEEWTGCEYIQIKEMSQDRAQWRRKISEWSSAVAKPHRGRSTSEWVIIKNNNYYRAMLCIVRTMLSQDVRPSVCPSVRRLSVTRRYSVEATKCIITLFFTVG